LSIGIGLPPLRGSIDPLDRLIGWHPFGHKN